MNYHTTKVRVRSGGKTLQFYIVEDLTEQHKLYTLGKDSCEWFDSIAVGHILQVLAASNGIVHSVIRHIENPMDTVYDEEWGIKKEKRF